MTSDRLEHNGKCSTAASRILNSQLFSYHNNYKTTIDILFAKHENKLDVLMEDELF
jgi:hypothetical protein